jgi:hypothetical protein
LAPAPKLAPAALGFRVKSGWAMSVLLAGPASAPELLFCQSILLSDPAEPASKQPYHVALELSEREAAPIVRKLRRVVGAAAKRSVAELLEQAAKRNRAVQAAALVVGSVADPESLHNDHMRAHGREGQLFRAVLEDALREADIVCEVLVEKTAYASAASRLRKTLEAAKRVVAALGESHDGSWRAEEKLAALAAWVSLAKR